MTSRVDSLSDFPLFAGLTEQELQVVEQLAEERSFSAEEVILSEGHVSECLWIIREGQCEVYTFNECSEEQRLALLAAGSVFGEMSFFSQGPHSASVKALTKTDVWRLTRECFDQIVHESGSAAQKIVYNTVCVLAERLREMDEWARKACEKPGQIRERDEWMEFRAKLYSDLDI